MGTGVASCHLCLCLWEAPVTANRGQCWQQDVLPPACSVGFTLLPTEYSMPGLGMFLFAPKPAVKFRKVAFLFPCNDPLSMCSGHYQVRLTRKGSSGDPTRPCTPTRGFKITCISETLAVLSARHRETGLSVCRHVKRVPSSVRAGQGWVRRAARVAGPPLQGTGSIV